MRRALAALSLSAFAACGPSENPGSLGGHPDLAASRSDDDLAGDGDLGVLLIETPDGATDGGPIDARLDGGGGDGPTPTSTAILLAGTIVTPDQAIVGQVLVEGDTITCVAAGTGCAGAPGAAGARFVDTHGVIAPGLIDTHNHILFDIFDGDDWLPSKVYQDHTQWPSEARYQAMLDVKQCLENASQGKPTWCANTPYGSSTGNLKCEMDKFGELKGLVAGTTSIVGLAGTTSACFGSLARSIDASQNGLGSDKIRTSALFPPSKTSADSACSGFAAGTVDAYLVHVGEGTDAKALAEWSTLGTLTTTAGCLYAPQTAITHGVAFTAKEFSAMKAAGMKLTWSPASNVALYGATADIPAALAAGVTVALAPDWSMGGSQNLLDEMRFANAWDDARFGNVLDAKALVAMTTVNAAAALGLSSRLGQIAKGYLADLFVVTGTGATPWDTVLAATPREVALVMVGGQVLYGDVAWQALGPSAPGCETIDVCTASKFLCVATTSTTAKLDETYSTIASSLEQGLTACDQQTPSDGWSFAPLAPLVKCQ